MQHILETWKARPGKLPTYTEPTHAMEIFRRAESGSVRFLWILCTNPAASLPDLERVRRILSKPGLFIVAQDAFANETTEYADVVLPAAMWGEKTGTMTNTDRTVHLCEKAVDPPGEARSDLDILLDYARRMDFRDRDDEPLVKWSTAEQAFDAWRTITAGRPCDYSGMTYAKLAEHSGLRWPCNQEYPEGKPRLYPDGVFFTGADECQSFGYTLLSGGEIDAATYRKHDPHGRASLKAAEYETDSEQTSADYPFVLNTGRIVYQFHTRTKTGRSAPLQRAAPEPFVQVSEADAKALSIGEGDWVEVRTRRGRLHGKATLGNIRPGQIFVLFYPGTGYKLKDAGLTNDCTVPTWDPVSKQPRLKMSVGQLTKLESLPESKVGIEDAAQDLLQRSKKGAYRAMSLAKEIATPAQPSQHIPVYLARVQGAEETLATAYRAVQHRHEDRAEMASRSLAFAVRGESARLVLHAFAERYGAREERNTAELRSALFHGLRRGDLGALEDLHDLHTLIAHLSVGYFALHQAARALHDEALSRATQLRIEELVTETEWLHRQIRANAAQALVVPSLP